MIEPLRSAARLARPGGSEAAMAWASVHLAAALGSAQLPHALPQDRENPKLSTALLAGTPLSLQAVQHLQRQLVTAERRHQIRALDALAHREQHLACDLDAFLARGLAARRLAHPLADHFRDPHAGDF